MFNDYDYRFFQDGKPASLETMKTFDRTLKENRKYYDGYIYKSIPVDKLVDLGLFEVKQYKHGKTKKVKSKGNLKQRIIVTYSRKMAEYQKTVRNRQIERAKKILANMDPDNFKKGPNDVTRFIKSDKEKKNYYLDEARIEEEAKYDGFYAVATNIFDMKETEVLDIQSRRYKIEDCFRVLKTNFSSRPVYHRKENRIKAHFLICYAGSTESISKTTNFTTESKEPSIPVILYPTQGATVEATSLQVRWAEEPFASTFRIELHTNDQFTPIRNVKRQTVNAFTYETEFDNLTDGTWYLRARSEYVGGETEYCDTISFTFKNSSGMETLEKRGKCYVIQGENPALVVGNDARHITVDVANLSGQIIGRFADMENPAAGDRIELSGLVRGVYAVIVHIDGKREILKLIH